MNRVEQVKEVIKGLSVSDRSDVLLYVLRLKYYATLEEIGQLSFKIEATQEISVESLSYDELLEQLHLLEGIRAGLLDVKSGNVVSHNEVKKRFSQWRKR